VEAKVRENAWVPYLRYPGTEVYLYTGKTQPMTTERHTWTLTLPQEPAPPAEVITQTMSVSRHRNTGRPPEVKDYIAAIKTLTLAEQVTIRSHIPVAVIGTAVETGTAMHELAERAIRAEAKAHALNVALGQAEARVLELEVEKINTKAECVELKKVIGAPIDCQPESLIFKVRHLVACRDEQILAFCNEALGTGFEKITDLTEHLKISLKSVNNLIDAKAKLRQVLGIDPEMTDREVESYLKAMMVKVTKFDTLKRLLGDF
jgi:hypothetical protein